MKKLGSILAFLILFTGCSESKKKEVQEQAKSEVKDSKSASIETKIEHLKREGYEVFSYKEGDTTYLMQQYYLVFLKTGTSRNQDSTETAKLMKKHLAFLERMGMEGYASLIGPLGDDGDIRGIAIYNVPTLKEADSLARLDPMVQAGMLEVEIHPWWTAKGGKLK